MMEAEQIRGKNLELIFIFASAYFLSLKNTIEILHMSNAMFL